MNAAPWMARLGLFRMIGYETTLPEPQRSYAQAIYGSSNFWDSLLAEAQAGPITDAQLHVVADDLIAHLTRLGPDLAAARRLMTTDTATEGR